MLSVAIVAVTAQVPVALVTERVVPEAEQPVDAPELYVTAPVPLLPLDPKVAVVPYTTGSVSTVAVIVWLAFAIVIDLAALVVGL